MNNIGSFEHYSFIRNFECDAFCPADLPTDRKERMKKRPKGLMMPLFKYLHKTLFAVILKVNKVLHL